MYNVSNKKVIRNIAFKSFKANKTRNIVAIIAIILTTVMFTSVFTTMSIMIHSFEQSNFKQVGGYSHGTIKGIRYQDVEQLAKHELIEEYSVSRMLGVISRGDFIKDPAEVKWVDEQYLKHSYQQLLFGNMPKENTNEFICDLNMLDTLGIEPIIGSKIQLTIELFGAETVTDSFVLSGYFESNEAIDVSFMYVARSYVDAMLESHPIPKDSNTFQNGRIDFNVLLKNSGSIEQEIIQIIEDNEFQTSDQDAQNYLGYGVNWGYTSAQANANLDAVSVAFFAFLLFVFALSGYLIIFNIFKISITNDIRFYGLLKTIGTTPKQIKSLVYKQAVILSAIGIPIGLALGYLVGYVASPFILSITTLEQVALTIGPDIFVYSGLFSLATVLISSVKPAKIASKISPIEAVRYNENNRVRIKKRKTHKMSPFGMAVANISRNKGKSLVVVASLSLALLVFQVTVSFVGGFSVEKYLSKFAVSDFLVAHAEYFNFRFNYNASVSQDEVDLLKSIDGVEQSGVTYGVFMTRAFYPRSVLDQAMEQTEQQYGEQAAEMLEKRILGQGVDQNGDIQKHIMMYGFEDFPLEKLTVIDGSLQNISDKNSIVAVYRADDYDNPYFDSNSHKVGDTVTVRHANQYDFYNAETNEKIIDFENYDGLFYEKSSDYTDVTYTVVATATIPSNLGYRSFDAGAEIFATHADTLKSYSPHAMPMSVILDVGEQAVAQVEEFLYHFTTTYNKNLDFESTAKTAKEFENLKNVFLTIGLFLSGIIGFIGILNFFNVVLTSISTRKKELAMLQSVGMNGKQLKCMLVFESLSYIALTMFIVAILTLLLSPMLQHLLTGAFWFYESNLNVFPLLSVMVLLGLIGVSVPLVIYKSLIKQSIMERLREIG